MYKVGSFVQAFGKDAYIISYILWYNVSNTNEDIPTCGFPKRAIPKVTANLERKKINYIIIDTRNNYDVDEKSDNKNLNIYEDIVEKSYNYIRTK